MFAGSVDNVAELPWKIADNQIKLDEIMSGRDHEDYLAKMSPRCFKHYQQRREIGGATWKMQPSVQLALFNIIQDTPLYLDYVLVHTNPQHGQILGAEDVQRGLDVMKGKSLLDIMDWSMGEGIDKKYNVYKK